MCIWGLVYVDIFWGLRLFHKTKSYEVLSVQLNLFLFSKLVCTFKIVNCIEECSFKTYYNELYFPCSTWNWFVQHVLKYGCWMIFPLQNQNDVPINSTCAPLELSSVLQRNCILTVNFRNPTLYSCCIWKIILQI